MSTWQGFSVTGSLRKLWHWLVDTHDTGDASGFAGLVAASAGNAAPEIAAAANDDNIIAQVVLAEVLAGNPAATDALTFDTPYTGTTLEYDHFENFTGGKG
jgi:hypothetical protein